MRIPWLRPMAAVNWKQIPGKQIYLKSGSPPKAQTIVDGLPKAELRIIPEPLFSSELCAAAVPAQVDFFTTRLNANTPGGLLMTTRRTNMAAASQIGEPEVFDFAGLSIVYELGISQDELAVLLNNGVMTFQFSTSQPVFTLKLHQIPASTGLAGIGGGMAPAVAQVGAPFASNAKDVTVNGFPRRIWSLETFSLFMTFDAGLALFAPRLIETYMQGVRYIR